MKSEISIWAQIWTADMFRGPAGVEPDKTFSRIFSGICCNERDVKDRRGNQAEGKMREKSW
jgi:hypothetical protein